MAAVQIALHHHANVTPNSLIILVVVQLVAVPLKVADHKRVERGAAAIDRQALLQADCATSYTITCNMQRHHAHHNTHHTVERGAPVVD